MAAVVICNNKASQAQGRLGNGLIEQPGAFSFALAYRWLPLFKIKIVKQKLWTLLKPCWLTVHFCFGMQSRKPNSSKMVVCSIKELAGHTWGLVGAIRFVCMLCTSRGMAFSAMMMSPSRPRRSRQFTLTYKQDSPCSTTTPELTGSPSGACPGMTGMKVMALVQNAVMAHYMRLRLRSVYEWHPSSSIGMEMDTGLSMIGVYSSRRWSCQQRKYTWRKLLQCCRLKLHM